MSLIDIVKDKKVKFTFCRPGYLYYITECGIEFPVPWDDISHGATFMAEDKAILYMRWIRKHLDEVQDSHG